MGRKRGSADNATLLQRMYINISPKYPSILADIHQLLSQIKSLMKETGNQI